MIYTVICTVIILQQITNMIKLSIKCSYYDRGIKVRTRVGQNSLMFVLLPVHGSFSKPTVTLNILAYSNTSSLLTHLTTFNTIPFKLTYILFLFLYIPFILFYYFFSFFFFIKLFYYTSFPFFKGCRLEKGHIVPFCVPIHKKKKNTSIEICIVLLIAITSTYIVVFGNQNSYDCHYMPGYIHSECA